MINKNASSFAACICICFDNNKTIIKLSYEDVMHSRINTYVKVSKTLFLNTVNQIELVRLAYVACFVTRSCPLHPSQSN